jgi:hypothetical protein
MMALDWHKTGRKITEGTVKQQVLRQCSYRPDGKH